MSARGFSKARIDRMRDVMTPYVDPDRPITLRDLLTFRMGHGLILAPPDAYPILRELMTTNQVTAEQKAGQDVLLPDFLGWGFGMSVVIARSELASISTFGWDGGLGTSWRSDPREELIGVLLTQAAWTSPKPPGVSLDFWTSAYQALDD